MFLRDDNTAPFFCYESLFLEFLNRSCNGLQTQPGIIRQFLTIEGNGEPGTAGKTLLSNAIYSVLLASVLMLAYIAFRFDLNSGIAAVAGLIHDVLMMLAFMVLLRNVVQMNSSFIAAMLTIVGYSINNTIVIFDRIRENTKRPGYTQKPRMEIVELSVSSTLSRTINTTVTTMITLVALYIFGVESIREFAFPLIIPLSAYVCRMDSFEVINKESGPVWICTTYNTYGKAACPSKAIPESILGAIVDEVGGIGKITALQACEGNTLVLTLTSGEQIVKRWQDRSRRQSWTPEMKEKARQKDLERRSYHANT